MTTPRKPRAARVRSAAPTSSWVDASVPAGVRRLLANWPADARVVALEDIGRALADWRLSETLKLRHSVADELADLAEIRGAADALLLRLPCFPPLALAHLKASHALAGSDDPVASLAAAEVAVRDVLVLVELAERSLDEWRSHKAGRPSVAARDRLLSRLADLAQRWAPDRHETRMQALVFAARCAGAFGIEVPESMDFRKGRGGGRGG